MSGGYDLEELAAGAQHETIGILRKERAKAGFESVLQVRSETIVNGDAGPFGLDDDAGQLLCLAYHLFHERIGERTGDAGDVSTARGAQLGAVNARSDELNWLQQGVDLCELASGEDGQCSAEAGRYPCQQLDKTWWHAHLARSRRDVEQSAVAIEEEGDAADVAGENAFGRWRVRIRPSGIDEACARFSLHACCTGIARHRSLPSHLPFAQLEIGMRVEARLERVTPQETRLGINI